MPGSTLAQVLEDVCARRAGSPALAWNEETLSFAEVRERSARLAASLQGIGPIEGLGVAIFLPNSPETILAHLGVTLAGGVRVPVNAAYTAREVEHPVSATECRVLVTDEARLAIAREAVGRIAAKPRIVTAAELLAGGTGERPRPASPGPDDLSLICFTSGTSGKPKGVPLTHRNLLANIEALASVWEWTADDALLLCLPLMHLHGLANGLNGWLWTGCRLILQAKFEPAQVLRAIERDRATIFFGVPAMYHRLLEDPRFGKTDLGSIRLWVSGSAPLPETVARRFEDATGQRICNRYGMTETVMITANPFRGERRQGSVGLPLAGMDVRVVDPGSGAELAPDRTGEIVVRGPSVAAGYWRAEKDEGTGERRGFFRTGDIGYRDADGYFYVTGRAKEIVISGGTNIAPLEIEEVIAGCEGVREAAVIGIPDPALGEALLAVVVPSDPALTVERVREHCERNLAKFKRPRTVRITREPLPRNAMQKLDRRRIAEIHGKPPGP